MSGRVWRRPRYRTIWHRPKVGEIVTHAIRIRRLALRKDIRAGINRHAAETLADVKRRRLPLGRHLPPSPAQYAHPLDD